MPRGKQIPAEQIIAKLREAEVELARGKKVGMAREVLKIDDVATAFAGRGERR